MNPLIVIFWFFHIQQRLFYSLYLWQLKEYRIDRFLEEIERNKALIFPKSSFLAFLLILFSGIIGNKLSVFVFLLYFFLGLLSLYSFLKKKWRFPKLTKKMMIFVFLSWVFLFGSLILFYPDILKFVLLLEIVFPLFLFFPLGIVQIPTFFIKRYIFWKAAKKREKFKSLIVIGITGSFGKSSTKEFLYDILSEKFEVLKTEGNTNTEIGVANTVLRELEQKHQIFICEMAAYKRGEIKRICDIVKPQIGIITGINQQHMSLFGSQENIIKGKFELIDSLPKDGKAILNWDNEFIRKNHKGQIKTIRYSVLNKEDIWAENIRSDKGLLSFKVFTRDGEGADFKVRLMGEHNVSNVLAALSVGRELDLRLDEMAERSLRIESSGVKIKKGKGGFDVIDASYSANPDSIMVHLDHLRNWKGRKIVVMPCLIELGKEAREIHRKIGEKMAKSCDLVIITTDDYFKEIKEGAGDFDRIFMIRNPKDISDRILGIYSAEDVVLLESRVPEKLKKMLIV